MSSDVAVPGQGEESDGAFQKAVEILEREEDQVIAHIFRLLNESTADGTSWAPRHTSNMLTVLSDHVCKAADLKKMELECNERMAARGQLPLVMGMTFLGVLSLCWMFLYYGKPEFIVAVITGITGFAGGYGYGKVNAEKK